MLGDGALLYTTRHAPSNASSGGFAVDCSSSRHLASTAAAIFAGTNNAGAPKGASSRFTSACSASAAGVATGAASRRVINLGSRCDASKLVATGSAARACSRMAIALARLAPAMLDLVGCCATANEHAVHTPWHKCCQTSRLQPTDKNDQLA